MSSLACSLPVIAGLFTNCAITPPLATGYVEGEYVLMAPVETARIDRLTVKRGDHFAEGTTLVLMEEADALIAVRQAEASLQQARAQLANLKEGRRPEEIAVIEAGLASARAQAAEARRVVERQKSLLDRGIAPQSSFDQARTALDQAVALVDSQSANLAVARLAARPGEIEAAQAVVAQAEAALDNARWRLERRQLRAPFSGRVNDVIRRTGEVAGPAQPVISVLPDGAIRLRLYAPETRMADIHPGTILSVHCDGCADGLEAKVSYIADGPEFTPPVIYSLENRQKLVYLIEARPLAETSALKPGQIVDVTIKGKP